MLGVLPDPLEAAQATTRRGLPRLKITDIKVIRTQVGNTHMTNAKVLTSEPGLINSDPDTDGWIFKLSLDNTGELDSLMDDAAYKKHTA